MNDRIALDCLKGLGGVGEPSSRVFVKFEDPGAGFDFRSEGDLDNVISKDSGLRSGRDPYIMLILGAEVRRSILVRTSYSTLDSDLTSISVLRAIWRRSPWIAISSSKGDVSGIDGYKNAVPYCYKLRVKNGTNPDSRTIISETVQQITDTTHVTDNGKVIDPTTDKVRILKQCLQYH